MLDRLDLRKLNSATKYPSIPTYHTLGDRGRLTEALRVDFAGSQVLASEKVDGTNSRIVVASDGSFIVGSRNDLLWFSADLLYNPAQGIVEVVRSVVDQLEAPEEGHVRVYYGESYGGRITGQSKQYTASGATGFRLFDVVELTADHLDEVLTMDAADIAAWREEGLQPFWSVARLETLGLPLTPRVEVRGPVPTDFEGVLDWMTELLPRTRCALDEGYLGAPEGLVLRDLPTDAEGAPLPTGRGRIAKVRFADYRKTLSRPARRRAG
jgi:hypothetical protein